MTRVCRFLCYFLLLLIFSAMAAERPVIYLRLTDSLTMDPGKIDRSLEKRATASPSVGRFPASIIAAGAEKRKGNCVLLPLLFLDIMRFAPGLSFCARPARP